MSFMSIDVDTLNQTQLSAFDHLTHLEHLELLLSGSHRELEWTGVRPSIRSSLLRLMHLPTIVALG